MQCLVVFCVIGKVVSTGKKASDAIRIWNNERIKEILDTNIMRNIYQFSQFLK